MSATVETPSAAAPVEMPAVEAPETPYTNWADLATSISCIAMDLMDLQEKLSSEKDELKKDELQKEITRLENEYAELFLIYEKTPQPEEDDYGTYSSSSYGWECDYENGQGCADW